MQDVPPCADFQREESQLHTVIPVSDQLRCIRVEQKFHFLRCCTSSVSFVLVQRVSDTHVKSMNKISE